MRYDFAGRVQVIQTSHLYRIRAISGVPLLAILLPGVPR